MTPEISVTAADATVTPDDPEVRGAHHRGEPLTWLRQQVTCQDHNG